MLLYFSVTVPATLRPCDRFSAAVHLFVVAVLAAMTTIPATYSSTFSGIPLNTYEATLARIQT